MPIFNQPESASGGLLPLNLGSSTPYPGSSIFEVSTVGGVSVRRQSAGVALAIDRSDGAGRVFSVTDDGGSSNPYAFIGGFEDAEYNALSPLTVFKNLTADGATAFEVRPDGSVAIANNKLGFFGTTPAVRPVVPLTTPTVQNVIDALVALGLVAQHD